MFEIEEKKEITINKPNNTRTKIGIAIFFLLTLLVLIAFPSKIILIQND